MFLNNIDVKVKEFGNKFHYEAFQGGDIIATGVVDFFSFNALTSCFRAGGITLRGVKHVKFSYNTH